MGFKYDASKKDLINVPFDVNGEEIIFEVEDDAAVDTWIAKCMGTELEQQERECGDVVALCTEVIDEVLGEGATDIICSGQPKVHRRLVEVIAYIATAILSGRQQWVNGAIDEMKAVMPKPVQEAVKPEDHKPSGKKKPSVKRTPAKVKKNN